MSCFTTSPTRRSRIVAAAVLIASAAASSHDVLLVPMTSVTLYTLMTLSFGGCQPGRCQERVDVRPGAAAARRALLPPGLSLALRSRAVQTGAPAGLDASGRVTRGARLTVVVSPVGGGGQVHQPVVGGEQPPDQAQRDHCGGGGGGGKDQEHHDGLDQDGL